MELFFFPRFNLICFFPYVVKRSNEVNIFLFKGSFTRVQWRCQCKAKSLRCSTATYFKRRYEALHIQRCQVLKQFKFAEKI